VAKFTTSWPVIAIAAKGFMVASIETYKTFLLALHQVGGWIPTSDGRDRDECRRSKFAGKPIFHPEYLERRRGFVPVYAVISALAGGSRVVRGGTFRLKPSGLRSAWRIEGHPQRPSQDCGFG